MVYKPLSYVVRHVQRVVQESSGGVVPLLPLLRFLCAHQTRLHNLATVNELIRPLQMFSSKIIE